MSYYLHLGIDKAFGYSGYSFEEQQSESSRPHDSGESFLQFETGWAKTLSVRLRSHFIQSPHTSFTHTSQVWLGYQFLSHRKHETVDVNIATREPNLASEFAYRDRFGSLLLHLLHKEFQPRCYPD